MPAGPGFTSVTGYMGFAVVKYVGYTASGLIFNKYYRDKRANIFVFGLVRTVIGMSLGAVVGLAGLVTMELAIVTFMAALIPFRIVEWLITLKLFYSKSDRYKGSLTNNVLLGVALSFAFDIPAAVGFLASGGLWIC